MRIRFFTYKEEAQQTAAENEKKRRLIKLIEKLKDKDPKVASDAAFALGSAKDGGATGHRE